MNYIQPNSLEELSVLLPDLPEHTVVLAGGTDLMPKLRAKRPEVDCMLSLWKVPELRGIWARDGWLRLGAMATHAEAAGSELVRQYAQALQMACARVGSQQIRNKGTLGGSLVNASPAGDIMPCLFLCGGRVELMGPDGVREVTSEEFLSPDGRASMGRKEILTAIRLPMDQELRSCFVKLGSRTEVTIAQISLCAAWRETSAGPEVLRAYTGAIDSRSLPFPEPQSALENPSSYLLSPLRRFCAASNFSAPPPTCPWSWPPVWPLPSAWPPATAGRRLRAA